MSKIIFVLISILLVASFVQFGVEAVCKEIGDKVSLPRIQKHDCKIIQCILMILTFCDTFFSAIRMKIAVA